MLGVGRTSQGKALPPCRAGLRRSRNVTAIGMLPSFSVLRDVPWLLSQHAAERRSGDERRSNAGRQTRRDAVCDGNAGDRDDLEPRSGTTNDAVRPSPIRKGPPGPP